MNWWQPSRKGNVKSKVQMSNEDQNPKTKIYDLKERTIAFGEAIIAFAKRLPRTAITLPLIGQIVRSGTSVAANYMEADTAITKKDFKYKLSLCRKEAKETNFWLRMLIIASPEFTNEAKILQQESWELVLIFSSILKH